VTPQRRAYVTLGLTFLLGGVAGGGAVYAALRGVAPESREAKEARRMKALEQRLGLSAEQRAAVVGVLERHREDRRRGWEQVDDEIRKLLGEHQRREFEVMIQERKARMGP
jgi:hypothetical protein